ncbi:MAG: hypothetical protein INR64_00270 [Caulobacteraceae bacterium]|nr:hypothetical protein [Caulobacter sp.]
MPISTPSVAPAAIMAAAEPGVDAPCAGIGAHLRCVFGDLSAAPLPSRMAELTAKLDAARAAVTVTRQK